MHHVLSWHAQAFIAASSAKYPSTVATVRPAGGQPWTRAPKLSQAYDACSDVGVQNPLAAAHFDTWVHVSGWIRRSLDLCRAYAGLYSYKTSVEVTHLVYILQASAPCLVEYNALYCKSTCLKKSIPCTCTGMYTAKVGAYSRKWHARTDFNIHESNLSSCPPFCTHTSAAAK